jgi:N-acylneuraminate cytidylyltransferase
MNYVALICARGGSKGLPGKNIRQLAGRPLIAWAIAQAKSVGRLSRVLVSTDSPEIAAVARQYGAEVPFLRPSELAQDSSPEWLVWRHALSFLKAEGGAYPHALVVVPATAPLRESDDIDRCLNEYEGNACDVVVTVTDAHRNPYFNMVKVMPDNSVQIAVIPEKPITRRQDAPMIYDMTTVAYVARPEFVMTQQGVFSGVVRCVHVPPRRAIDIDTATDFEIAECLMAGRELP